MSFLHGIEFAVGDKLSPVAVRNASIIGLVGTAPEGPINTPTLVISRTQGVELFGSDLSCTIPKALKAIFDQGKDVGYVIVVNVGTEVNPLVRVTNETVSFTDDRATLAHQAILIGSTLARAGATITGTGVGTLHTLTDAAKSWTPDEHIGKHLYDVDGTYYLVTDNDATTLTVAGTPRSGAYQLMSSTIYWENVDYVVDYNEGFITRVAGHIPEDTITMQMYDYYTGGQPVAVSDVIGGVDPVTEQREGVEALLDAEAVTGYKPKLLIAPEYSSNKGVMDALLAKAALLKGRAIGDIAEGSTPTQALTWADQFDNINMTAAYPLYKFLDETDGTTLRTASFSPAIAGVWSRVINQYGYWYSPSNHEVMGVEEMERAIDYIYDSAQCTASLLNEKGITTCIKRDRKFYIWGNLSVTTDEDYCFAAVQMTRQVHQEALIATIIKVLDRPINRAWFEDVQDTVQAFLNGEVGKGAIIYGSFQFLAADNPPEEIRLGHVTARWDWTPAYPAQKITIKETLNIEELAQLFAA